MQANSIIEKAQKLGLDVNGVNQNDILHHIAEQIGVNDLEELDQTLDSMLNESNSESDSNNNEEIENLDTPNNEIRNEKFGQKEYDQAKNENGVYDKNHYKSKQNELDKKLEDAKHEESLNNKKVGVDENGKNKYKNKNVVDKFKDSRNVAKARQDAITNKLNNAKASAYNMMHPGEALKDKVKNTATNAAKNVGKKAAKGAAKAGKAAGKAVGKAAAAGVKALISFIAANPIVLIIVVGAILLILLIVLLFGGSGSGGDNSIGYYDTECNFNDTTVNLSVCQSSLTESLTLQDYVIGTTYSYINNNEYSDETIKALMIIIKTNALSDGNYNSSSKSINIDDCKKTYTSTASISSSKLKDLENNYSQIEEELFVSKEYSTTISNLSSSSSLSISDEILENIESLSSSNNYSQILDKIYNTNNTNVDIDNSNRNNIFVGDSRILSMKNYDIVNDNNSIYATSMGYNWFIGSTKSTSTNNCETNAINCVNEKIQDNSVNIVIWLGVNDINNYDKYYNKYYELATNEWSNNYIYIVSVGYVNDELSSNVKNNQIEIFNDNMQRKINGSGLKNLKYINLGYASQTMSNGTSDGIHYTEEFSNEIYNTIISKVGSASSVSSVKKIYKLSDYCTFYSLTENDAYWWPIGSSNTTGNNIYGGNPTTTTVTSPFGPRTVEGKYSDHKGIDITNGCNNNNVIATKSGTVTTVNNSCDNTGGYDNTCGGGYGNYVIIDHGDGTSSVYAHMYPNSITVSDGTKVEQGEKIGEVGNSGSSTACHLHFEIRINGIQVDPLNYISANNPRPMNQYNLASVDDSSSTPEENKVAICKSLLNSGYSTNAVAGMLVNIQAEGSFRTNNLENCYEENQCCFEGTYGFCKHPEIKGFGSDTLYTQGIDSGAYPREKFINDRAGYGLIQWTSSGRKAGLYDYAKAQNKSIAALSVQLGWLLEEVKGYSITYKYITGNYSAYDIANNFCLDFESPKNENTTCPARASNYTSSMLTFVENGCS